MGISVYDSWEKYVIALVSTSVFISFIFINLIPFGEFGENLTNTLNMLNTSTIFLGSIVVSFSIFVIQSTSQIYGPKIIPLFQKNSFFKLMLGILLLSIIFTIFSNIYIPPKSKYELIIILFGLSLPISCILLIGYYVLWTINFLKPESIVNNVINDFKTNEWINQENYSIAKDLFIKLINNYDRTTFVQGLNLFHKKLMESLESSDNPKKIIIFKNYYSLLTELIMYSTHAKYNEFNVQLLMKYQKVTDNVEEYVKTYFKNNTNQNVPLIITFMEVIFNPQATVVFLAKYDKIKLLSENILMYLLKCIDILTYIGSHSKSPKTKEDEEYGVYIKLNKVIYHSLQNLEQIYRLYGIWNTDEKKRIVGNFLDKLIDMIDDEKVFVGHRYMHSLLLFDTLLVICTQENESENLKEYHKLGMDYFRKEAVLNIISLYFVIQNKFRYVETYHMLRNHVFEQISKLLSEYGDNIKIMDDLRSEKLNELTVNYKYGYYGEKVINKKFKLSPAEKKYLKEVINEMDNNLKSKSKNN
ncbi:DUF2254 family protein [Methanococcus maripaludis]|uniref:DUF2254 domain-containing protein n=1 Tax=Methanococcus maripaludis OS7 TaxID=637915 RepID=A0A2Z5PVG8_METMI|nr:DUF2254 family protein [Methanococcus maripaludis]BAP62911.1 hypothetical protein MMOS7_08250 [Methanococcus maripaludis OS7]